MTANPQDWELNTSLTDDIDAVGQVYRAEAFIEDSNQERMPYILRGFDQGFASHGVAPTSGMNNLEMMKQRFGKMSDYSRM